MGLGSPTPSDSTEPSSSCPRPSPSRKPQPLKISPRLFTPLSLPLPRSDSQDLYHENNGVSIMKTTGYFFVLQAQNYTAVTTVWPPPSPAAWPPRPDSGTLLIVCQPAPCFGQALRVCVSLRDDLHSCRTGTVAGPRPAVGQDTVGLLKEQPPGRPGPHSPKETQ